jgi:GalNAc-alpha-(1->4)-GalNAc-alpha-(1->3)-diNAcBac-PP-undecaprenol alpha-1,4-N-acetyl-D-galactosaminyltransferase
VIKYLDFLYTFPKAPKMPALIKHDIAMVISDMGNGGTQRVYATIANAWAKQGRRICIITQSSPESDFHKIDDRVTRISCNGLIASNSVFESIWRNLSRVLKLRQAISNSRAPITIAAVTPMAILSIIASIRIPTRIIVSERNDPARQSYGKVWDILRRIFYPRADLVTANSYGALRTLQKFMNPDRLEYLPNPLSEMVNQGPAPIRQPVILNVGRMYEQKAQGILLRAFAVVAPDFPEWRLAFAGTGPLANELKAKSEELGVADRVDWLGAIQTISGYYDSSSIFALPSHYEGMPNALLEAMRSKLPCIISDASPGPLEIIEDKVNGLVFPVDNVAELAKSLSSLIVNEELRSSLGEAAYEKSQDFAIVNVLVKWEKILGMKNLTDAA